jgi:MFS family permease
METGPPKKNLSVAPFAIQVTRGLLRDERSRRKTMGISLLIVVLMVITGLTVLRPWLNPHEHPWRFVFFWFACAWEIILVLLLALLDLLLLRAKTRAARKALQEDVSDVTSPGSANFPEKK